MDETQTPSQPLVEDGRTPEDQFRLRLQAIAGRLEREAEERVGKRNPIEQRWLDDLRQYHGKYDDITAAELARSEKSRLFINQTRPKTNAMEARLSDMLFPTDDRNWGIQPTPVPELTVQAEQAALQAAAAAEAASAMPEDPNAQVQANVAQQEVQKLQSVLDEARKRARAMEEEIDDHLRACRYAVQAREVIHDACKLGTGILKGPVTGGRMRATWQTGPDGQPQLVGREDTRPVFWRVDPWSFFPDPDARTMEDCESTFERHLLNAKQVRALAKTPGFDEDAIRRLLRDRPRSSTPSYIADLRALTGGYQDSTTDRYQVWEYHGPLDPEDVVLLYEATEGEEAGKAIEDTFGPEGPDPLQEVNVILWFCQGEILKFGVHPLDSADPLYSVFCLERDETGIFGFGVPYVMRDSQRSLNAAWRTMMDNAGLSSGPQIEVNQEVIEPADGKWTLAPRKIWYRKRGAPMNAPGVVTYNIDSHQAELANIVVMSKQNIDDETALPVIAQGEQGSHVTQTAHGMNILMNSVNVVFRRIVKNWDDDLTTPTIRRIYDWLMQFSPKEAIKGDYEIDARGTSVLLVREMQSANLLAFLLNFGAHPTLSAYLKEGGLPAMRRLVRAMNVPADELVKTDEDLARDRAEAAKNPAPPDPEMMKLEAELNDREAERQFKWKLAEYERETVMLKAAADANVTLEELRARLEDSREERRSAERKMAVEAAMTQRQQQKAGADKAKTGGGHF